MPDRADQSRRAYDASRRRAQAQRTREDIAATARRLFTTRGWGQTTVRDVAREAGVSEPTVYNAYGGKLGLAMALLDHLESAADVQQMRAELAAAEGDPGGQLAALVALDRRLFERGGDLLRLMREAGRTEPQLAAAYLQGRRHGDENRRQVFGSWSDGTLAVDLPHACDIFAALCNVDVYTTLLEERQWSPDQIERWWHAALTRLLLRDTNS